MVDHPEKSTSHGYQAPTPLVVAFYLVLLVWSVICIRLIQAILEDEVKAGAFPLFMIGFILFYIRFDII